MSEHNQQAVARYRYNFLKEVEECVEDGEWVRMCMQCGAEMIVTPCQLRQANVGICQSEINKKQGTQFAMPVVYYSQLMSVAYGGSARQAGLDRHVIQPKKLQGIAGR